MQVRSASMWRPLLLALLLVGCGSAQEAATTTTEASTTTVKRTTTTVKRTTTSVEKLRQRPVDSQRETIASAINAARTALAEEMGLTPGVRSVDKLDYVDDSMVVAVTSNYNTSEVNEDLAWRITTDLGSLWGPDGSFSKVSFPIGLRLSVSNQTFSCPGDFMLALADVRADRTDWTTACT
jgi:hypothetical protein